MFRNLFLVIALTALPATAFACNETRSFGTNYLAAAGNCALIGGRTGQCIPMNAQGNWWSCACMTGCGFTAEGMTVASIAEPNLSCSCHALDRSNPFNEQACNALSVGTTCARVGNLICIPECR